VPDWLHRRARSAKIDKLQPDKMKHYCFSALTGLFLPKQTNKPGKLSQNRLSGEVFRYFVVSLLALGTDFGLLILFHETFGLELLLANAISFSSGAVVAYAGSILWVFGHRRVDRPHKEFILFFAIGLGGLLVNEAVLWVFASASTIPYQVSKLFAAGSSFVFNFIVRKWLLFRENNNPTASAS
jgi:putative flippase GtrA